MTTPNVHQIFEHCVQSTIKTLEVMCKTPATAGEMFEKGTKEQAAFDVAGMIGITSPTTRGSVGIFFPKAVFLKLLTQMLGEPATVIDKDNEDAAAELMNIIFGDAKKALNQLGHDMRMAVPSVFRGNNVVSPSSKLQPVMVSPFRIEEGEFYLEFSLANLTEAEKVGAESDRVMTNAMKAAFFKPFVDSTINSLKVQCGITATPGTPSAKKSSDATSFDIAGTIGITSRVINGSYMLSFKNEVFLKLISKMLGEEYTEVQPGLEDAVTELLNIILGSAKVVLNSKHGHAIQMALPTLVYGDRVKANLQSDKTTIVIPFYSDVGMFIVEVMID